MCINRAQPAWCAQGRSWTGAAPQPEACATRRPGQGGANYAQVAAQRELEGGGAPHMSARVRPAGLGFNFQEPPLCFPSLFPAVCFIRWVLLSTSGPCCWPAGAGALQDCW
jgi:hypothetical protein